MADVPPYESDPEDLTLHGPRVLGYATADRVAEHYDLDPDEVEDLMLEFGCHGWVSHARFSDSAGWFLTDDGRGEDERRMGAELDKAGARDAATKAHQDFLPLNGRFGRACTDWQVRPTSGDPMAINDHADWPWDERVMRSLASLDRGFGQVAGTLAASLQRFDGYAARYSAALVKVNGGQRRWVDDPEVDSCHTVWIQFHEDLLSTLGLARGADG